MACFTESSLYVGGELQRFAIAVVAAQSADIYMIDEPSSYLDVRQRLKAAQVSPTATFTDTSNGFCIIHCCAWTSSSGTLMS